MNEFTPKSRDERGRVEFSTFDPEDVAKAELSRGERLLWSGQPDPSGSWLLSLPVFIFAIPWTSFAVFWTVAAFTMTQDARVEGAEGVGQWMSYIFPLFGLPFIAIGFGMLSSPLFEYKKAKRRVYAITDRRALIIEGGNKKEVESYPFSDWKGEITRSEKRTGKGSLKFGYSQTMAAFSRVSHTRPNIKKLRQSANVLMQKGFYGIKDPRRVEEILRRALRDFKAGEG